MKWSIPSSMIDEGRRLVLEHRVLEIIPDIATKKWQGVVLTDQIYNVSLDGTPQENDSCLCHTFQKCGYCEHTIACELYLKEEGFERYISEDIDYQLFYEGKVTPTDRLMVFENGNIDASIVPLNLHLYLKYEDSQYFVSLKASHPHKKRQYLIKDMVQFQESLAYGMPLVLGKNNWYISEKSFSKKERGYLKMLRPFLEENKNRGQWLKVSPTLWMSLVLQLNNENTLVINDDPVHLNKSLLPLPISLEISIEENRLKLCLNEEQGLLVVGSWVIVKNYYYKLSSRQLQALNALHQLFLYEKKLYFDNKAFEKLYQSVIPQLKDIIHIIYSKELLAQIQQYPLEVHLFASIDKSITLKPVFYYGKYQLDLSSNQLPFLIRNKQEEQRLIQRLYQFGYTQLEDKFIKPLNTKNRYYFFEVEKPYYDTHYYLHMDQSLKAMGPKNDQYQPVISIDIHNKWLDIDFDISGITKQDLVPLMDSIQKNDHFFTTLNGDMIDLYDESFERTRQALIQYHEEIDQSGHLRLPIYRALTFEHQIDQISSEQFKVLISDLKTRHIDFPRLKTLKTQLRPYQEDGLTWLKMLSHYHLGGILADDMGLGKTIQIIAYLLSEKEVGNKVNALILAPSSVVYNWQAELKQFAPSLKCQVVFGNKKERIHQIQKDSEVIVTSYASFRQDFSEYKQQNYNILILDEAQMVKNAESKTFKAIHSLNIPQRFALSGTPIENKIEELWAMFELIMPGFFPEKKAFKNLDSHFISKMIQPFVLRRTKEEVLLELPERTDMNYYSPLTTDQKAIYIAYLTQMQQKILSMDTKTFSKNRIPILAGLTRLRQICCTPKLFDPNYQGTSGKLELLKTLLIQAKETNRRVLLFSQFTTMFEIIKPLLEDLELQYFELTGKTKTNERLIRVEEFNNGKGDVFLISLKAGGTGLNLTGADTVILFDSWWNPAIEEQAAGRVHRIGQHKNVEVWHLIAEGTIEERIYDLQQQKKDLFKEVMDADEESKLSNLSDEDIRYLLTYQIEEEKN